MKTLTLAAVAALLPLAAQAHDGMHVEDAYVRSSNAVTAAAFMRLENHRAVDCTLQAVTTPDAERAERHSHQEQDGIMRMGRIEGGITTPAGDSHLLQRGGDHIMLLGLTKPLKQGDHVALTLDFGDCGTVDLTAPVDNRRKPMGGASAHAH